MSDKIDGLGRIDHTHKKDAPGEAPSVGSAEARTKGASSASHSQAASAADHVDVVHGTSEIHHGSALADAFKTPEKNIFVKGEHRPLPKDLNEKNIKKMDLEKLGEHKTDAEKHHFDPNEKGSAEKSGDHCEKPGENKHVLNEKGLATHGEKGALAEKVQEKDGEKNTRHMEKDTLEKAFEKGGAHAEKHVEKENWEKVLHQEKDKEKLGDKGPLEKGLHPEKDLEKGFDEKNRIEKHGDKSPLEKGLRVEKDFEKGARVEKDLEKGGHGEKGLQAEKQIEKENWEKAIHPEKGHEKGLRLEKSEEKWIEKFAQEKQVREKDLEIQPLKDPVATTPERFFF